MPFSIFQKQTPQSSVPSSTISTPNLATAPSFTSALPTPASFTFDMTPPRPNAHTGYSTPASAHAYSPIDSPSTNFRDDLPPSSPVASMSAYNSAASRVGSISSKTSHKIFPGTRHELRSKSSAHSLKSKLSRKLTSASTKSTSSQPQSLPPIIPELPPLEVPEHYEDLTDLFSRENTPKSQTAPELPIPFELKPPAAPTGIARTQTPEPISNNNRDSVDKSDLHTYEFYDLDKITNSLNPNSNPKLESPLFIVPSAREQTESFKESVGPSPEPTTPVSEQTSKYTNTAATSPTSIQKPKLPLQKNASFSSKIRRIFRKRPNQMPPATAEPESSFQSAANSASHEPQDFSLPFTNSKVVPHFSEINGGPTYKAQVVRPTNPQPTPKTNNLDPGSATYLMNNNSNDTEPLNFVPNLRPGISNMGSRFRTTGVASPANIVMTKSQYDKYLLEKKEKNESGKSNAADKQQNDEDDDDSSDDSDDDEFDASRRALDNEENKHQDMRMRMRQDAHLSIYRQKMVKLTGSQIGLLNTKSKSKLPVKRNDDDSDEDDVPLGILKTHGFPRRPRTASQPNLLAPELTYSKRNKSSGDLDSLHSTPSTGPTTPAVEEGYLAMRNQSVMTLPGFNASVPMNRGLVGEIAKEESAKSKRKPMLNSLGGHSKETDDVMIHGKSNQSQAEIQAQIQQMMSMQNKILTQMAGNNSVAALNFTPTMSGGLPRSSNWSSFDVMNSHQPPISRFNAAPSVKSFSNSSRNSVDNQMSAPGSEEEDDDDDEKGWKEMEMKRKQMRQMWKAHQVLVL